MATWELSPAFQKVSKKLGNMVFYNIDGETFARKRPGKRTGSSPAQDEVTDSFSAISGYWKYLEGIIQDSWNFSVKNKKRVSGYSAFIGANVSRQRDSLPLDLSRSMGELGLASFSARTGTAPGEIICEFAKHSADAAKSVTFFRQKRVNTPGTNQITRIEPAAGTVSPYVINSCEPGSEYIIYAVVTDKAYAEAKTVSMAHSSMCIAGQ